MIRSALVAAVLAVAAVAAAPAAAQPASPPIEAYASLPALSNVAISPDGDRIAFIGQVGETRGLIVRSLAGEALGGTDIGDTKVVSVRWADNDHVLITTSTYTNVAFAFETGDFLTAQSYNVNTRQFVTLLNDSRGGEGRAGTRTMSGSGLYNFVYGPPRVEYVNGEPITLVTSLDRRYRPQTFQVDLDTGVGVLREDLNGVLGVDGRVVADAGYEREMGRFWVSAKQNVGFRQIWSQDGFEIDVPSLIGLGRTPDTVLLSIPGEEADELYELPLDGGEPRRLAFGDDLTNPRPIYDIRTNRLLGFEFTGDNSTDHIFLDDEATRTWQTVFSAAGDLDARIVSTTPDWGKVIVALDGEGDPGSYLLVDVNARQAVRLGSRYPNVPGDSLADVRFISYTAADGMEIPAYLTIPAGRDARDLPLIVMPHGGPQARDYWGFDPWSELLASRGYAVLRPQYRGSDGFGARHIEAGYGEWGRKMQTDLSDGVRYLAAEGIIDPERVCIYGWSYGGYAAMAAATVDPEVYRCAVAGAGLSDLPRFLDWAREQSGGRDSLTLRYWKRFMGAERIGDGSLVEVSPARLAEQVDIPVLLIHGEDDSVVPIEQSEFFERALRRAGRDVEFVRLVGEDHNLSRNTTSLQALTALVEFLEEHNPPD